MCLLTADWQGSLTAAISTWLNTPDNLTHTHPCLLSETNFRWRCFEKTAVCILYVDPPICVGRCGRDSASFLCQTQLCQTHVGRMRFSDQTAVLIWVTHFSQTLLGCVGLVCVRRGFVTKKLHSFKSGQAWILLDWYYCISFPTVISILHQCIVEWKFSNFVLSS